MSYIPLDLERRFERRWAARFAQQAPEPSSRKRNQRLPMQSQRAATDKDALRAGIAHFLQPEQKSRAIVARGEMPALTIYPGCERFNPHYLNG